MSGAGISTNADIPDYQGGDGIFAQLVATNEYPDACSPESFLSRTFVNKHPEIFDHSLVKQFCQQMLDAEPTEWFNDLGILHRVYTQTIDGLYQKTGLPTEKIVEYHGNYSNQTAVLYGDPIPESVQQQVTTGLVLDNCCDLLIVMGSILQVAPFCALPNLVNKQCTSRH